MAYTFNTQKLQTLIQIVRQIVTQEIDKITSKSETVTYGTIMSVNGDNTHNVEILGLDSVLTNVINKSLIKLAIGDTVAIKSNNGNLSNGYIDIKLGGGSVDCQVNTLAVNDIDYTITDAEYDELIALLGGDV